MDKQTLSNYGWLVIVTLILAVMLALATPFGTYVGDAVVSVANGFVGASDAAIDEDNIATNEDKWDSKFDYSGFEEGYTGANKTPASELPAKGKTLEQYTWAEVKSIISNGKATEYGFTVGATKSLTYSGNNYTARIIGLDQDGTNTATFMFTSSIGNHVMNPIDDNVGYGVNTGGFAASDMNSWLNSTAYGLLGDDVKSTITSVTKTSNLGIENPTGTSSSSYKLFLLSVKEVGLKEELNGGGYSYMDSIDAESTSTYTYFQTSGQSRRQEIYNTNYKWWWLRSANSHNDRSFSDVGSDGGLGSFRADVEGGVVPAFVIG